MTHLDNPALPAAGTFLCRQGDLDATGAKGLQFRSGTALFALFVVRLGERVFAYVNSCPHAHYPLDFPPDRFFNLAGTRLLCRAHGAQFEIDGGRCVEGPCLGAHLTRLPLEIDGDRILLGDCS